jgi:hypothetical protein
MAALETNTSPRDDGRRRSGAVGRHPPAHRARTRGLTEIRASSCSTSRSRILDSDGDAALLGRITDLKTVVIISHRPNTLGVGRYRAVGRG